MTEPEDLASRAFCDAVERRTGMRVRLDSRAAAVARFVGTRIKALGLPTWVEYVRWLEQQPVAGEEFASVVSVVSNPHTFFFRDPGRWAALRDLLRSWKRASARPLCAWSAGCATGDEPYSLGMLGLDLGVNLRIVATDISRDALAWAGRACYSAWSLRHLPSGYRDRFFEPEGDGFRVRDAVRRQVTLRLHNLVEEPAPVPSGAPAWDWILCQNVLCYFGPATVSRVASSFARVLAPDGWLFVSATESLHHTNVGLRLVPIGASLGHRLPADDADAMTEVTPRARPSPAPEERGSGPILAAPPPRRRDEVRGLLDAGNRLLRAHAFEQAIAAYSAAQERAPLLAEPHYLLGVVYRKLGDLDRAAFALRQALFIEPRFWCASFLLAGVLGRLGREAERRGNLAHTLAVLRAAPPPDLFASDVRGMEEVDLPPADVRRLCEQYLARDRPGP